MLTKLITGLVLCAAATGCTVSSTGSPPPSSSSATGTLSAYWTLDGYDDATVCADYAVDRVDVVVYDADGFNSADARVFCEDFGVSFDLGAGWYSTEMTLLDVDGFDMSDTVVVDVRVLRDTDVTVDVDFPGSGIF